MKNALILHGTEGASSHNWFPWLKGELEGRGWRVWVPDLPQPDKPDIERYNKFIFSSDWEFNAESYIIGHSSGSVAILGLLEALPDGVVIDTAILVGAFRGDLGWPNLRGMVKDFDFAKIKARAKRFVFIHSDNDRYCPMAHAEYLSKQLDGELIVKFGQNHFSTNTFGEKYREFPFVLNLLTEPT